MAELVFLITGLLAHEHDRGTPLPLPEHSLGRVGPQLAGPAALHRATQLREGRARGQLGVTVLVHDQRTRGRGTGTAAFDGGSATRSWSDARLTASTAASNASAFFVVGSLTPLTLRTNCRAAARISSSPATPSTVRSRLMLRHMTFLLLCERQADARLGQRVGGLEQADVRA